MSETISKVQITGKDILSKGKMALSISICDIANLFLCYAMAGCRVFADKLPFVVSIYAAAFAMGKWPIFIIASLLGLWRFESGFSVYMPAILLATALMALSPPKLSHRALFSSLALFCVLMVRNIIGDAYWYDYFMSALEVGACYLGVHIFAKAVPLIINSRDRRYIDDTEIVCVFVLLALVVRFASNIPLILGMDVSVMLAIFLLSKNSVKGIGEMLDIWYAERDRDSFTLEREAIARLLDNMDSLGADGVCIKNGEEVIAFSLGSMSGADTFDVHFEKASSSVPTAYTAIAVELAKYVRANHPEAVYLNREDDMGIEGLRRAKESWYPHHMIEKYTAEAVFSALS